MVTKVGTNAGEQIEGSNSADYLSGLGGNDSIFGYGGNEYHTDTVTGTVSAGILGGEGNDFADGGLGRDYLDGGNGNDTLYGGEGNYADTITGGAGKDSIDGEDGNDSLMGNAGDDTINGQDGNDSIYGGTGSDVQYGGLGNDSFFKNYVDADNSVDYYIGGQGNDVYHFEGTNSSTAIWTLVNKNVYEFRGDIIKDFEKGHDKIELDNTPFTGIHAGAAAGTVLGYSYDASEDVTRIKAADTYFSGGRNFVLEIKGNITLSDSDFIFHYNQVLSGQVFHGTDGKDGIVGTDGADTIFGGGGTNDEIFSGKGNDSVTGGSGQDSFVDYGGNDTFVGGDGTNWYHLEKHDASAVTITGGAGNDLVYGGAGNDFIFTGAGNDTHVTGGAGNDLIYGGAGNDGSPTTASARFSGDAGNDTIYAGSGDDSFGGGAGVDCLFGGIGADHFIWWGNGQSGISYGNRDIVNDFSHDQGDKLDFGNFQGTFTFRDGGHGTTDFHGSTMQIAYQLNSSGNTIVMVDSNADNHTDFEVMLAGDHHLVLTDFIF